MSERHFRTSESRGGSRAAIRTLEIGCGIERHSAADTTAGRGRNNCVYALEGRSFAANARSYRKHPETLRRLTAAGAVCVIDAAS